MGISTHPSSLPMNPQMPAIASRYFYWIFLLMAYSYSTLLALRKRAAKLLIFLLFYDTCYILLKFSYKFLYISSPHCPSICIIYTHLLHIMWPQIIFRSFPLCSQYDLDNHNSRPALFPLNVFILLYHHHMNSWSCSFACVSVSREIYLLLLL